MTPPTEYEIRLSALTLAVQSSKARPSDATLAVAQSFAAWLREGANAEGRVETSEPVVLASVTLAESVDLADMGAEVTHTGSDVWGVPCVRCVHSSGIHTATSGCTYTDPVTKRYCTCGRNAASAAGRYVADVPSQRTEPPAPEPVCQCKHREGEHGNGFSRACNSLHCGCTEYRP